MCLCLVGWIAHRLVSDWIRPAMGKGHQPLAWVLGVLPNFLGAALVFPFGGMVIGHFLFSKNTAHATYDARQLFVTSSFAAQVILVVWELWQIGGPLVFDWFDLLAAVVGGVFAFIFFKKWG